MARRSAVLALLAVCMLAPAAPSGASQSELVIAKASDKEYHWPGCERIKDGKGLLALTRAQAATRGLKPHEVCDPSKTSGSGDPSPSGAAPDPLVSVDSGRYYHKKDCTRLWKDPRKLKLDDAGKKYWPCPACKPPIRKRKSGNARANAIRPGRPAESSAAARILPRFA